MPVILIGEAPSERGGKLANYRAFDARTRSGAKLARLAGVADVADVFGTINLIDRWPGRTSHGAVFPAGLARRNANRLWTTLPPDVDLLLIGLRVAASFDVSVPYLRWETLAGDPDRRVAVFPHPSGVNRWWNDPKHEVRARRFLRRLAAEEAR
jgi:hypothetical protein